MELCNTRRERKRDGRRGRLRLTLLPHPLCSLPRLSFGIASVDYLSENPISSSSSSSGVFLSVSVVREWGVEGGGGGGASFLG